MVTGALSTRPDNSAAELELDLPEPEMPPVDPALVKPVEAAPQPQLARPAQIDLPPLPDVAVTMPPGLELSGRIAAQAEIAAAGFGRAIGAVRPWGGDVSSGVETRGQKDHRKIRDFVINAQQTAATLAGSG